MRILLTNYSLENRAGSELYAAELATWLRAHGHHPVLYSARPGPFAGDVRRRGIPVVDDLMQVAEPPDIIHAQHHLPTMAALARFPDTPAVYFCHGWLPWEEWPARHPAIRRYVAVSRATRERLVSENGVPPGLVQVLPNFVDLSRFVPREPLPAAPARALVFSNQANGDEWVAIVRSACDARGIALDVAGHACGRPLDRPEQHLGRYDLVFARGRSAIEAMAVGAAVVLCDTEGLGPLVTLETLERVREGNYGMQVLSEPHRRELVLREIDRYDPHGAAQVAERVRRIHSLDTVAAAVVAVYAEALDAAREPHARSEAERSQVAYAHWLNRTIPVPWLHERESLFRQAQAGDTAVRAIAAERDALAAHAIRLEAERDAAREAQQAAQHDADALRDELAFIQSGFLFRRVLPIAWRARLWLLPAHSRRLALAMRLRRSIGRALRGGDAHPEHRHARRRERDAPGPVTLSCVVLDVGGQPTLADAVRSLAAQDPAPEIVVVSSGGGDAARVVADAGVDAVVIESHTQLPTGAARNVGVAATHGTHVAFLANDCVAEPGWVAGRLAAHAAGASAVSSAVTNHTPWNPFASAAHHLLFAPRLPGTPPAVRLHYGASYARTLLHAHGGFRHDLRVGEDTEFHARACQHEGFTFRPDVAAAHRNPTTLSSLLRDQYRRGRRAAQARRLLTGQPAARLVATNALARVPRSLLISLRGTPLREWPRVLWGLPWMPAGACAYALGAMRSGHGSQPAEVRRVPAVGPRLLCVITFRNEGRFLPGFLDNVAPQVDGILALDDGSTDGSADIVERHPAVLELLRIAPRDPHVWDERRNRRLLVDAAGRHGAQWVIGLDADERLERHFRQRADAEMERGDASGAQAYSMVIRELWDAPDQYRTDAVWGRKRTARLFRYRPDHAFNNRELHGQWAPENSRTAEGGWREADLILYHLRMVRADDRERRKQRYMTLDPDRRWQSIGYEYLTDDHGLELATFPPERDYTPLATHASTVGATAAGIGPSSNEVAMGWNMDTGREGR